MTSRSCDYNITVLINSLITLTSKLNVVGLSKILKLFKIVFLLILLVFLLMSFY